MILKKENSFEVIKILKQKNCNNVCFQYLYRIARLSVFQAYCMTGVISCY